MDKRTMGNQSQKNYIHETNKNPVKQDRILRFLWAGLTFLLILLILAFTAVVYIFVKFRPQSGIPVVKPPTVVSKKDFKKFVSEEEFKEFIAEAAEGYGAFFGRGVGLEMEALWRGDLMAPAPGATMMEEKAALPQRVSETTVQVKGIDEPDIVKTDGSEIYFSSDRTVFRPLSAEPEGPLTPLGIQRVERKIVPPPSQGKTRIIEAFPPDNLGKKGEIEKIGNLLLKDKILIIFSNDNKIYGFDVSNSSEPKEKWNVDLKSNTQLVAARLYKGKVYFVTQSRINRAKPCPIVPLVTGGLEMSIKCSDIYHPVVDLPVDVTFSGFILDPENGKIEKSVSFVGSSGQSVIYMSPNALYTTYNYYENMLDFFYKFLSEKGKDLVPSSLLERLEKIQGYDLSNQAKMTELNQILEEHYSSLDDDERMRIKNEFTNRVEDYTKEHMRELERMGIVKIGLDDFSVLATGDIAGQPLNQFSLDEYQGNLRVATTVGGRMFSAESANDVYVLDKNLNILGTVEGLGLGERIYSVRFIEDKGYLVTFKQIDPFFVLDLSDPRNPKVKGELKIPGYSSYLHPIAENKILGIGKEGSQVKISLFDVADVSNPTEASKYLLDENWSDILSTHHAFLLDTKHKVFFLPGSKGGYVFAYEGDDLQLKRAVSDIQARRAIYINDYMYFIGDDKIVILNENDWQKVNELEF